MVDAIYTFLQGLGFHHPLHPPLTHLPMGLVMACFVFSLLALILSQPALLKSAYHCCLLAAVSASSAEFVGSSLKNSPRA